MNELRKKRFVFIILLFFVSTSTVFSSQEQTRNIVKPLFSIDLKFQDNIDKGQIPEIIKNKFEKINIQLSPKAVVVTKIPNIEWIIIDRGIDQTYTIIKKDENLDICPRQMNFGDSSNLKLGIIANKQSSAYEPILFTVKLANISENEILDVILPLQIIGKCDVFDPDGNKLPLNFRKSGMMVGGSSRLSEPGEIFSRTFNLLDYFDMGKQVGKYMVEYHYPLHRLETNDKNQTYTVDNGVLISKLDIEVTEPDNNEKEALSVFQPAIQRQLRGEGGSIIVENYKRILKEYPTSK